MTIEERTKKIVRIANETFSLERGITCGKFIETQIREAVDEAQQRIVYGWDATEYVSQARAEAYEDAAKICDRLKSRVLAEDFAAVGAAQFLAGEIRARATGVKNEKGF